MLPTLGENARRDRLLLVKLRALRENGVDLQRFYSAALKELFGESGTAALLFHLGRGAVREPEVLVSRIVQLFGLGSPPIFECLDRHAEKWMRSAEFETPHADVLDRK